MNKLKVIPNKILCIGLSEKDVARCVLRQKTGSVAPNTSRTNINLNRVVDSFNKAIGSLVNKKSL